MHLSSPALVTLGFRQPERSPPSRCWVSVSRPLLLPNSIRSTGLSVLEFGRDPKKGLEALAYQGKLAVQQDGAECILLGCAGFVDFVEDLSAQLGVPVLDGVMPAVKFAEAMVDMGLRTSKVSTWGFPEQKNIVGFPMFTKQELIF